MKKHENKRLKNHHFEPKYSELGGGVDKKKAAKKALFTLQF